MTNERAAGLTPAALSLTVFSVFVCVASISISGCKHTGGSPERSLCRILHGNHDCRSGNDWSCSDRTVCGLERPPDLYSTHHGSLSAHPCYPNGHLCGPIYRPIYRLGDPGGHPNGHVPIPNPAPGRWTDWIRPELLQSLLQGPTRKHISQTFECSISLLP